MQRLARSWFCVLILIAGIGIGVSFDSGTLFNTVEANAVSHNSTDSAYRELGAARSALAEGGRVLARIAALTTPSVVHIQSEHRNARRVNVEETGSGVIVRSSKATGSFVVTNRHVVADAPTMDKISVHLNDGRVIHPLRIWSDVASDIAVLRIEGNHQSARWGDSNDVEIGHMVLAMGSPFGLSQSVTFGIISAKGRRSLRLGASSGMLNQDFLQTDAAINPGNSGGPLIDLQGRVIGINTAIASNSGGNEGIGFSIPSNLVKRVVALLLEHGKVQRAYLGVKLDPDFDAEEAERLTLERLQGARVVEVYPNTPASKANLKIDDVILSFDGVDVQDENHLINLVSLTPVGKRTRMVVLRSGKKLTFDVDLGNRTMLDERSQAPPQQQQPGMGTPFRQMGLTLHQLDQDLAIQLGYDKSTQGLLVLKVEPEGPLSKNLELYDLIEEVSRKPVSNLFELERVLAESQSRDSILLKVKRQSHDESQSELVIWQQR